ncbi:MAG: hemolysin expression modulating protein [Nitrosomonas sp.]|nr:hemolysin expression modulating protein [Nitrosomonas sp.]
MAVTRTDRPNLGSGSIKFIDGMPFEGIGSAGFRAGIDLLIIGDDLDNFDLIGGDGHDEIEGGGGNDILKGGLGNGILNGGDGNDDLDGQQGTEKLFGGSGDDILRAGDGYDRLNGGTGSDTFGFYGTGHFEIADFELGVDRLFFDSSTLGIHDVETLVSYITKITPPTVNNGYVVEFVGGAATIELIGVDPNSITADMIVFTL